MLASSTSPIGPSRFFYVLSEASHFDSAQRWQYLWHNGFKRVVTSKQMRWQRERHMINNESLRGVRLAVEFLDENLRHMRNNGISRLKHIPNLDPRSAAASRSRKYESVNMCRGLRDRSGLLAWKCYHENIPDPGSRKRPGTTITLDAIRRSDRAVFCFVVVDALASSQWTRELLHRFNALPPRPEPVQPALRPCTHDITKNLAILCRYSYPHSYTMDY